MTGKRELSLIWRYQGNALIEVLPEAQISPVTRCCINQLKTFQHPLWHPDQRKSAELDQNLCRAWAEVCAKVQFLYVTTESDVDTLIVMSKGSKTVAKSAKATPPRPKVTDFDEATFAEISKLISASRERALQSVNTVLIDLYWKVGEQDRKSVV